MKELNEVANIFFPSSKFTDALELFVKIYDVYGKLNKNTTKLTKYVYNTWMNTFAAKKYYKYCDLGNIYLKLNIKGTYRVHIYGSTRNAAVGIDNTLLSDNYCENASIIRLPNIKNFDGIFFELYENPNEPIEIIDAGWYTDVKQIRDNKLSIVICTYKRENYIYNNINLFNEFLQNNPKYTDKLKFIIVDNGRTIDNTIENENIKLYKNKNAGGAGGFTRGLIEILKNFKDINRVLFMDDDVTIIPESFTKTLLLSNYLKDAYKNSFINGAMLDMYDKTKFFENLAVQDNLWVRAPFSNFSLCDYGATLFANDIDESIFQQPNTKVDSAWWYHCFSVETAKANGLPMPVFFRGDDVEWSWRNYGKHHISMNGICVWHAPFTYRVTLPAEHYYLPRNMFFINCIYTEDFKYKFKSYFFGRFNYLLRRYDYSAINVLLVCMKDILKGSSVLREDPEKQFKRVNKIATKDNIRKCTTFEVEDAYRYRRDLKKIEIFLHKYLQKGLYIPDRFWTKTTKAIDWYPPEHLFILAKEVKVYNPLKLTCETRRYNKNLIDKYNVEFRNLLNQMINNYDCIKNDIVSAHNEFKTEKFWSSYLGY